MKRTYTAAQIADLTGLMHESDQYTEEQKSGMRVLSAYLLEHSTRTYEEIRDEMKGTRQPEERRIYPPFREELIES